MQNPFLPATLYRSAKDDERIEKARRADQENFKITDPGFSYSWFSQGVADSQGFYEEWMDQDGSVLAVTHTSKHLLTSPPVSDARYSGIVLTFHRRVNGQGNSVPSEPINVLVDGKTFYAPRESVKNLSDIVKKYVTDVNCHVRIEEDNRTILEGPLKTSKFTLDITKQYTIVFEPEKIVEKPIYIDRVKEVPTYYPPVSYPSPPPPPPSPATAQRGFITYSSPLATAMPALDKAIAEKVVPAVAVLMDCEGNKYTERSRLLRALTNLYKSNRITHTFQRIGITASTPSSVQSRAKLMGIGTDIVVMVVKKEGFITQVPFSSYADWQESIGIDLTFGNLTLSA